MRLWLVLTLATLVGIHPKCDAAMSFDGVDDLLIGPDVAALDGQGTISVVTWLYMDSACQAFGGFFGDYDPAGANGWGALRNNSTNDIFIFFRSGSSTPQALSSGGSLPSNQWVHVAILYDGSQATEATKVRCQINGSSVTLTYAGTAPATTGANTNHLVLGSFSELTSSQRGKCRLDDFVAVNRVLSQAELDMHRLSKQTFRVRSPTVEWPLVSIPDGTDCHDLIQLDISGNGNNGVGFHGTNTTGCAALASIFVTWP